MDTLKNNSTIFGDKIRSSWLNLYNSPILFFSYLFKFPIIFLLLQVFTACIEMFHEIVLNFNFSNNSILNNYFLYLHSSALSCVWSHV